MGGTMAMATAATATSVATTADVQARALPIVAADASFERRSAG